MGHWAKNYFARNLKFSQKWALFIQKCFSQQKGLHILLYGVLKRRGPASPSSPLKSLLFSGKKIGWKIEILTVLDREVDFDTHTRSSVLY